MSITSMLYYCNYHIIIIVRQLTDRLQVAVLTVSTVYFIYFKSVFNSWLFSHVLDAAHKQEVKQRVTAARNRVKP